MHFYFKIRKMALDNTFYIILIIFLLHLMMSYHYTQVNKNKTYENYIFNNSL